MRTSRDSIYNKRHSSHSSVIGEALGAQAVLWLVKRLQQSTGSFERTSLLESYGLRER
jgi:hypothetical protein